MADCQCVNFQPRILSEVHGFKLVDIVDFRRRCPRVIVVKGAMDEQSKVMGFETPDDTLVHWLDVCSKVQLEIPSRFV